MRVITGEARGRRLFEPSGMDIRPTTDKVKESLFNIIAPYIPDARVLDIFAGTGQLGIEALSRGASSVVFVDSSRVSCELIKKNLRCTGFSDRARVVNADALKYAERGGRFDVVLADPPYGSEILDKLLILPWTFDILNENGIIVCESAREKTLTAPEGTTVREYSYGKTKLTIFRSV